MGTANPTAGRLNRAGAAHLGDGRGYGHAGSEEDAEDGHIAGSGRAAREGHEVVPEVCERQRRARQPWGVPCRHLC